MLTKYGYTTIGIVSIIVFLLIVGGIFLQNMYFRYSLFTLAFLLLVFTLQFFRDPDRTTPPGDNNVITPADGKVLLIKDVEETSYLKGKATQIAVFMSPINVHVNRNPVTGIVEYSQYIPGEYIAAFEDKASERNERWLTGYATPFGKILISQIAGFVARRIINELTPGQKVISGERFGMIKFGSRVDILVPPDSKIKVKPGDVVYAGETIVAELPK